MGWTGGYVLVALFSRALSAQIRPVHDSRLPRRALWRQHRPQRRHFRRDPVLVHLRGRADLRRRHDHQPLHRARVRHRRVRRSRRHPGVLVPGRHARGDLDPGRAVHHSDHRLPDAGGLAVGVKYTGIPGAAARLRVTCCRRSPSARRSLTNDPKEIEVRNICKARAAAANASAEGSCRPPTRATREMLEQKLAEA